MQKWRGGPVEGFVYEVIPNDDGKTFRVERSCVRVPLSIRTAEEDAAVIVGARFRSREAALGCAERDIARIQREAQESEARFDAMATNNGAREMRDDEQ